MFLKLKILLKLFWSAFGINFLIAIGIILWFVGVVGGSFLFGGVIFSKFREGSKIISVFGWIIFYCILTWIGFYYNDKKEKIDKEYQETIKIKSEKKAKKGALSKHNEFENDMKGTLHYMDEVLNRKVK